MARKTGTIFWLSIILDHEGDLDAVDKLLLIGVADHVDDQDRAHPGLDRLARRAGKSYDTAKRRMATLAERGYIERTRRHRRDGSKGTYEYRLVRSAFGVSESVSSPAPDHGAKPALGDAPRVQNPPWPRGHLDALAEVPRVEPEEEEQPDDDPHQHGPTPADLEAALDELIDDIADQCRILRDEDKPHDPVRVRRSWLAKARKRLRADEQMPRAAMLVRHPSAGCIGRPDAPIAAAKTLAELHRNGEWPDRPAPRRRIEIDDQAADEVSTDVDSDDGERTEPTDAVRQARARLSGARR